MGRLDDFGQHQFPRLHYILTGISQSAVRVTHYSQAKTSNNTKNLDILMEVWAHLPESVDAKMLWEACCLGLFAFLRAGEFTYDPRFDKAPSLTVQDLAMDSRSSPSTMTVHLRRTRTNQFGRGVTLCVGIRGKFA